jgi:4-amino-4-deoxy-L-arabinose transferase-like glycosyltransferase
VLLERAALVAIFLAATFFRVYLFEAAPPGLQHDEVFKANFAQEVLDGGWPVFFDPNGGEEALFPYLAALSILLLGHNFFALRLVSLSCGLISLAVGYSLTKSLFNRRVALLTTALLSVSFWHIFDSRVALRPITLLMMGLASFYVFWLGLRRGRLALFALSGLFLGGSLYTYTSGFLIPLTVVLYVVIYLLPFQRRLLLQRWRGIVLALAVALIVFLPMAYHLRTHPLDSTARARDLGDHLALLLEGQPGPIARDVLNVLGMFGVRGDPEWRYNLAGRPVFDPLTFLLFCGGLVLSLRRAGRSEYAFLLLWLVINIIPSAVTRNSPSTLRAIGSLTAIYILPSLALDFAWPRVRRRFGELGARALGASIAALLLYMAFFTYMDYFTIWARNSEVRAIYRADLTEVARFIDGLDDDEVVCVSASFAADLDQQVLNFMLGERRAIRWFDGQQSFVLPAAGQSQDVIYAVPATGPLREELRTTYLSGVPVYESVLGPSGEPAFVAYRLSSEKLSELRAIAPSHSLSASLGDRVELRGYELPSPIQAGGDVSVALYWRVPQPIRPDLQFSFFAHLVDTRGFVWDQVDTLGYPVSNWIEDDLLIQLFDLAVPPDAPPLEYQLKLGMYDEVTGVRLTPSTADLADQEGAVSTELFSLQRAATPTEGEELEIPRERYADFDGVLTLLGCDVGAVAVERDEPVHVSLYWRAMKRPEEDYLVSILVTDESGGVLWELLREPVDGLYPTSQWTSGEVVRDRFDLIMDASVPEGRHRLWARVWDPTEQRYLLVRDSDEDRVRLGKVYVGP